VIQKSNKPLVAYLAYEPYGVDLLKQFIKSYNSYRSGYDHDLLICFKSFNKQKMSLWSSYIPNKFIKFYDRHNVNDFDIGSFFRIAENFPNRLILFLNSFAKPKVSNWLRIFIENYHEKSIVGCHGVYASISSMFLKFQIKNITKFKSIKYGLKHLLHCSLFPNPHIRTNGFLINSSDFLLLKVRRKNFDKKIETNYFESGRNSISAQLRKRGFDLYIVNSDNRRFLINEWPNSDTFALGTQSKLVIEDHRTAFYEKLSYKEKIKIQKIYWGKFIKKI
jgi:hypothetical protein